MLCLSQLSSHFKHFILSAFAAAAGYEAVAISFWEVMRMYAVSDHTDYYTRTLVQKGTKSSQSLHLVTVIPYRRTRTWSNNLGTTTFFLQSN